MRWDSARPSRPSPLAHLAAEGQHHFLVVCPASVLINWTREIRTRSTLRALPVHGPDRHEAYAEWGERGGVAITTFDTLHTLPAPADPSPKGKRAGTDAPTAPTLGMLVVDEAHYVKNPDTRRTRSVALWTERCDRVLFLTGTPMENRVEEFRTLVRHLRPDLLPAVRNGTAAAGPHAFRKSVAPAYLRRNQEDVLTELPALVQVDEWVELGVADREAYDRAVGDGNFMAMRRAAYADPEKSAKLQRLRELVAEAADNGVKVVVFSYFRDVLAAVEQALEKGVFGPISGSVPAARRQQLVDDFTQATGHAVLLSQIEAGGVGLNLQAASLVILCEPQVKPTVEHQARARVHRMGQIRTVQVHRMLAADSVDDRLLTILKNKDRLFDAFARRSDLAEATPDAIDISDASLARRIVEEEQRRLAGSQPSPFPRTLGGHERTSSSASAAPVPPRTLTRTYRAGVPLGVYQVCRSVDTSTVKDVGGFAQVGRTVPTRSAWPRSTVKAARSASGDQEVGGGCRRPPPPGSGRRPRRSPSPGGSGPGRWWG